MERSGNFYKAIQLGYILISILIGCMAYNSLYEWQEIEALELGNKKIDELRKEINNINIQMIKFSLLGETILEWNDKDIEHYHARRMAMDSMLCRFKQSAVTTIPIEDIGIVVLDNQRITITQSVLEQLIDNNCAVITCNQSHLPIAMHLPLEGNTTQTERMRYQIEASLPLKKQLWQQTIVAKIQNQAAVLRQCRGVEVRNMLRWATQVKSGDSDNMEARAAVYYWQNAFPTIPDFVRSREAAPPNNLLNYGYAILRAIVARGLVSSGLLPTLGIHHRNKYNAYCLADDIMEPYRPYVDKYIFDIFDNKPDCSELNNELKSLLLQIPVLDVTINSQRSPLMVAVSTTTASLQKCYSGEARKIIYPTM